MLNNIMLSHFIDKQVLFLNQLNEKLQDDSGVVRFLNYTRQFDNGKFIDLTSHKDWLINFKDKYLKKEITNTRLKQGMNYWRKNSSQSLSVVQEDARDNFDIDARIELVYRDEISNCYHMYSFYSNKKLANKAYNFYDFHRTQLLKFISYFNRNAADLIVEAGKEKNILVIPEYTPTGILKEKRSYASELKEEGASLKLSDREFETMLLYAGGASAKQIAYMFDKSTRTVETHMQEIRRKTGNADRLSMHKYIIENGWGDLIRFFFPYIPAEAA